MDIFLQKKKAFIYSITTVFANSCFFLAGFNYIAIKNYIKSKFQKNTNTVGSGINIFLK